MRNECGVSAPFCKKKAHSWHNQSTDTVDKIKDSLSNYEDRTIIRIVKNIFVLQ